MGRIRCARAIGKELAKFYSDDGENQKSVAFLSDTLKTYLDDGWIQLAANTQLELAECYRRMDNVERYAKTCAAIASSRCLHASLRNLYFEEMLAYTKMLSSPHPLICDFNDCFVINSMEVDVTDRLAQECQVNLFISLESLFPRGLTCTSAAISVEEMPRQNSVYNKKKLPKSSKESQIQL